MYENQLSRYGAIAKALPFTPGKIFFVVSSSDSWFGDFQNTFPVDFDGQVRVFSSLSAAYDATVSGRNDVIVLDGNTTHTLTSMLTVSKNCVHFVGVDYLLGVRRHYGQSSKVTLGVTTAATDIATMLVTGVRCSFRGIKFSNANTVTEGIYAVADGGEYTYFENCEFYKETDLDQTGAAELVANGDSSKYVDCYIGSTVNAISGAVIRPCVTFSRGLAATGKVARDVMFKGCIFARKVGNAANRFVYGAEANAIERLVIFEDCIFFNINSTSPAQNVAFGATLTDGYVLLRNCSAIGAATAMSTTTGVFVDGPVPAADTTGISLQAS